MAAGATLLAPTPLGLAIGGTLVAVGGKLCSDYYGTILAEIDTVKDPPRGDYNLLAPAGASARQDRYLKALGIIFRRRRADELAAGRALATRIRQSGSAPRLSGAQVSAARSTLLGRLSAHGLSSANMGFAGTLLRPGPLDVLATLGR